MAPTLPRGGGGKTLMSAPGRVSQPSVSGAKTLHSNSGFEDALARAEAVVAQSHARLTGHSTRPQPTPAGAVPTPLSAGPIAPAVDARAPKSARRGSRSGRRSNPAISVDPGSVEATTNPLPLTPPQQAPVQTKRFEEEVTTEGDRATVIVRYDDLDEQTNVLSGMERGVEIDEMKPSSSSSASRRRKTVNEDKRKTVNTPAGALPIGGGNANTGSSGTGVAASGVAATGALASPRESTPPGRDLSRITAVRVALVHDPVRGAVEVMPLVPNEPAPAGLVTAILVPVDGSSSAQLQELLSRPRRGS
jgi:hypothetical protein